MLQVDRVDADVVRDLFEMQLQRETGLGSAMAALRAARRLVGEDTAAFEAVGGDVVGHRLEGTCIKGRGHTIRAVGAAIERGLEMHRRDESVLRHAGPHPHQDGVSASVCVEDLFAGQRAFDWAAGEHGQLADDDLVREGVGLAAETAPMRRADDADPVHRKLEDLGQGSMYVVDDLRRGPQGHPAIDEGGDGAVLLHRQVRVALEEEDVFTDVVCALEARVDVAELERDQFVDVVGAAVVLDALVLGFGEGFVDGHHRFEDLVLD